MGTRQNETYPLKWVTPQIAVGYAPHSQGDIDGIKSQGIGAVLNLCAECDDLHEIEVAAGLAVHWLPIADEHAPELNEAREALAWMDSMLEQSKKVLVHCRFGIGRTGTLVVAWLLKQGYSLEDALDMLDHTPAGPQSRPQWEFLDTYAVSAGRPVLQKPVNLKKDGFWLGKFFRP